MTSLTSTVLEQTMRVIDTRAVNVAADISEAAFDLSVFEEHEGDASKEEACRL